MTSVALREPIMFPTFEEETARFECEAKKLGLSSFELRRMIDDGVSDVESFRVLPFEQTFRKIFEKIDAYKQQSR